MSITRIFLGAGQIAVVLDVLDGISRMEKASVRRSQAGEQQHVETMAVLDLQRQALESLIARPEAGRPRDGKLTLEVDRFMGGEVSQLPRSRKALNLTACSNAPAVDSTQSDCVTETAVGPPNVT